MLHSHNPLAAPTQDCQRISLCLGPYLGGMRLACCVTGYTGVEFLTARVLDGDDVEGGGVVGALGLGAEGEAVNGWRSHDFWW